MIARKLWEDASVQLAAMNDGNIAEAETIGHGSNGGIRVKKS